MMIEQCLFPRHISKWVVAVIVFSVAVPAVAWGPPPPLVSMNVVDANPWVVPLQPGYAWPITLTMTVRERDILGIGVSDGVGWFPPAAGPGFLVFEDLNSCPSFIPFRFDGQQLAYLTHYCPGQGPYDLVYPGCTPPDWGTYLPNACPDDNTSLAEWLDEVDAVEDANPGLLKWQKDERWLQFGPSITVAPWLPVNDPFRENGTQEVWTWGWYVCQPEDPAGCVTGNRWLPAYAGPNLGSISDGISFGRSNKLPGLVVLADHGPGLLQDRTPQYFLKTSTEIPEPDQDPHAQFAGSTVRSKRRRGISAGFVNSVGYHPCCTTIAAPLGWGKIRLQAHFNVPDGLFTPVVMVDKNVDNPITIDDELCGDDPGERPYRMDGGPLQCAQGLGAYYSVDPIVNDVEVTVRVFVVEGDAPEFVTDENGDGVLDIRDVEIMGYEPLSAQRTFTFRQFHQIKCEKYQSYDFDGNGEAGGCVLGARAGIVLPVSRADSILREVQPAGGAYEAPPAIFSACSISGSPGSASRQAERNRSASETALDPRPMAC